MFKWLFGNKTTEDLEKFLEEIKKIDDLTKDIDEPIKKEEPKKQKCVPVDSPREANRELRKRSRFTVPSYKCRPEFIQEYHEEIQRLLDIKKLDLSTNEYQRLTEEEREKLHIAYKYLQETGTLEILQNVYRNRRKEKVDPTHGCDNCKGSGKSPTP